MSSLNRCERIVMREELEYLGHSVVIQRPEELKRTKQGLTGHATTELHETSRPTNGAGEGHGGHGSHGQPILVTIDGRDYLAHRLRNGYFHTHELPFIQFETIEKLARAIVHS